MTAETGEAAPPQSVPARRSRRALWIAVPAVVVVAAGATAVVLLNGSDPARGEASASLAAHRFTTALNAGDKDAAAAVACANFADEARAAATAGADPDIDFALGTVRLSSDDAGSVVITQQLHFPGTVQREPRTLRLDRSGGKWLVCGQA